MSTVSAKLADVLSTDGSLAEVYPPLRQVLSRSQRRNLLGPATAELDPVGPDPYVSLLRDALGAPRVGHLLGNISYAEARTYMHDVLLRDADQMSMAHGLEVRVPLLDHALAERVVGLPDRLKRPGQTPKRLLVESLSGLLPDEIVNRPKRGFVLPMPVWLRGPLRNFCETRLGPTRLAGRGIFRPDALVHAWTRFLAGDRGYSWSRVWLLVALEEWLAANLPDGSLT
jgi:asparagine synthase (glutamine-hydrolysing)